VPWLNDDDPAVAEARRAYAEADAQQRANGHASGPILAPIDPATLQDIPVPQRQWLVPDWVPMARVTALYGSGGEGKTLLAQMLATAAAIGGEWLGLPVHQCNSLLYFCEDDLEEMQRRQDDINQHHGCDFADLSAIRWLPRLGDDNALMAFEGGRARHTELFGELLAAAQHGARLVVTDTLADIFTGNENDRGQARMFAQSALGYLAREINGAVVALAHPSHRGVDSGEGGSGSSGWLGAFRSQLFLATPKAEEGEPPEPDVRMLRRVKANFARRADAIELQWRQGVFIPLHQPGILGSIEQRSAERVFLDLLDRISAEGRYVSDSNRAPNFAPRIFALRPDRERFTQKNFERAMQSLFASKEIGPGKYKGANRHEHDCILKVQK
jgi:RecA-family ATPase